MLTNWSFLRGLSPDTKTHLSASSQAGRSPVSLRPGSKDCCSAADYLNPLLPSTRRGLQLLSSRFSSSPSPFLFVVLRNSAETSSETLTPVSLLLSPFLLLTERTESERRKRERGSGKAREAANEAATEAGALSLALAQPRRILAAPRNKDPTTAPSVAFRG